MHRLARRIRIRLGWSTRSRRRGVGRSRPFVLNPGLFSFEAFGDEAAGLQQGFGTTGKIRKRPERCLCGAGELLIFVVLNGIAQHGKPHRRQDMFAPRIKERAIAESLKQTTDGNTLTIAALWNGEGTGTENDPYIVTDAEDIALVLTIGSGSIYMRLPDGGVAIEGSVVVPLSTTAVNIDLNGGSIAGATGEPAILLLGNTAFTATGTGTISADEGIEAVKRQGSVTAASGVTITGIGGAGGGGSVPAPAFAEGGASEVVKFAQAEGGKWTITAFAELGNASVGEEVTSGQVKVYAADTVDGLKTAYALTEGVAIENKSAVKSTIQVTAPSGKDSQFFKVKFGE